MQPAEPILIRRGTVVDGTGAAPFRTDLRGAEAQR